MGFRRGVRSVIVRRRVIGGRGTVRLRTRGVVRRRPGSGLTDLAWWGRVARWLLHELLYAKRVVCGYPVVMASRSGATSKGEMFGLPGSTRGQQSPFFLSSVYMMRQRSSGPMSN